MLPLYVKFWSLICKFSFILPKGNLAAKIFQYAINKQIRYLNSLSKDGKPVAPEVICEYPKDKQ